MSYAFWCVDGANHADDPMSILDPALAIIGGGLGILVFGDCDHADDPMSILHLALAIIGGELCILVC